MTIKNILVAMDGSDNAIRALKHAASWAAMQPGTRVRLLFVHPAITASRAVPQSLIEEHYTRQEEAALKKARNYLARTKLRADLEVRIGDPATTIVDYARQKKCGLIVMGNRGHGVLAGIFLGSVAMKVVQVSTVPVTLVK